MTEEEKKAIEYFKDDINYLEEELKRPNFLGRFITIRDKECKMLKILLNLIEKLRRELDIYKNGAKYKNCANCGKEFRTFGKTIYCEKCKNITNLWEKNLTPERKAIRQEYKNKKGREYYKKRVAKLKEK